MVLSVDQTERLAGCCSSHSSKDTLQLRGISAERSDVDFIALALAILINQKEFNPIRVGI